MNQILIPVWLVFWIVVTIVNAFTGPQNLKGWCFLAALPPSAMLVGLVVGKALERKARHALDRR